MLKQLLAVALLSSTAYAQCRPMPKESSGFKMGPAIPPNPSHIASGCSAFEVLIARGTSEPNSKNAGKFGMVVGDPLVGNLTKLVQGVRGYPVQYPASSNAVKDTTTGRVDIINRITKQSAACPNQKFALVGYSLGAAVIHASAAKMPAELVPKVLAIVLYGDPMMAGGGGGGGKVGKMPEALRSRIQENCSKGDNTCDRAGKCFSHHLDYVKQPWIDRGAKFIAAAFQGKPMPAQLTGTMTLG